MHKCLYGYLHLNRFSDKPLSYKKIKQIINNKGKNIPELESENFLLRYILEKGILSILLVPYSSKCLLETVNYFQFLPLKDKVARW